MLFHVQDNADKIRQYLPEEHLGQFDSIVENIDGMFKQASGKAAKEAEGREIKTPRMSNAVRSFSFSVSEFQLPKLPKFESRFICLQLAALFSCADEIDDTVADHLREVFGTVVSGMIPFILLCDVFNLQTEHKLAKGGGFGQFFPAVAKADAPPGTPAKIAIKIFRTDKQMDQGKWFNMACNEIIVMKKFSVSRLFPALYSYSFDPALPFIAQEYIEGGTLRDYIDTTSLETRIEQLPKVAKQLAAAVQYMDAMNTLHRDLKPDK